MLGKVDEDDGRKGISQGQNSRWSVIEAYHELSLFKKKKIKGNILFHFQSGKECVFSTYLLKIQTI